MIINNKTYNRFIFNGKVYSKGFLNNAPLFNQNSYITFIPPNTQDGYIRNNGTILLDTSSKYWIYDNSVNQYTKMRYRGYQSVSSAPNDYASILLESYTGIFTVLLISHFYLAAQFLTDQEFDIPADTKNIFLGWGDYLTSQNSSLEITFSNN